jgi:DNA-binding transcriptional regulator GbsR (MarR family)
MEKQKVIELWLACKSYDELSEQTGISKGKISILFKSFKNENYERIAQNPPESLKLFNLREKQIIFRSGKSKR